MLCRTCKPTPNRQGCRLWTSTVMWVADGTAVGARKPNADKACRMFATATGSFGTMARCRGTFVACGTRSQASFFIVMMEGAS